MLLSSDVQITLIVLVLRWASTTGMQKVKTANFNLDTKIYRKR